MSEPADLPNAGWPADLPNLAEPERSRIQLGGPFGAAANASVGALLGCIALERDTAGIGACVCVCVCVCDP